MIDPALLGRLRTIAGNNLEELAGASLTLELPLTNAVVNRLIEQRLSAASGPVSARGPRSRWGCNWMSAGRSVAPELEG